MPVWLKRMLIRLAVLLPVAVLVYEARHYVLSVHPRSRSNVQRVTVLNQPKPTPPPKPAPEPEVRQPIAEQKPSDVKQQFFKFDDYGPGDDSPPGPRDDMLGVDAAGGAGSDAFGLIGKRGGQDITTIGSATIGAGGRPGAHGHGDGGPMARFAAYATTLEGALTAEINSHADLRTADYTATLMVWMTPEGRIKRVRLSKSTGMATMDDGLRHMLMTTPRQFQPPPSDMPQPVDLKIVAKGATTATP